jgi:predicted nucleic acid-binding protein
MILLDTSVLIDALRTADPRFQQLFTTHGAAVCGVTKAEVLYGARDAADYHRLDAALANFPNVDFPESLWERVGQNLFQLRTNGVTVPFQDVVIATLAIATNLEVWTRDHHYPHIQRIIRALKLFQEPP